MRQQRPGLASEVADELCRYLNEHPDASDTVIGVTKFWLKRDPREPTVAVVEAALDELLARGVIERHDLPGGSPIFRRSEKR